MLKTSNNVKLLIASTVSSSATSISLLSASGLPTLSPTDYTIVTLIRNSDTRYEIVKVTEIVGNVLTVVRAQEGTTALTFSGGDSVRNYFTSGMFEYFNSKLSLPSSLVDDRLVKLSGTDGESETTGIVVDDSDNVSGVANLTISGTFNGRDIAADAAKLDTIEAGATADQSDSEIEAAYNAQVAIVSQVDAQAGTGTDPKRWTPERVKEAIVALTPTSALNSEVITQASHGFILYDCLYMSAAIFIKGQADSSSTSAIVGVVSEVIDTDNFRIAYSGKISWGSPAFTVGSNLWLSPSTAGLITTTEPVDPDKAILIGKAISSGLLVNIDISSLSISGGGGGGGGGILPSATSSKTADYTIVSGDVGTRIILGSATAANKVFTLDVSLLADYSEQISFENKSDYRLQIVVSSGTMTINDSMTDIFLWKGDGVLTITGDTSTNCTTVAGY